MTIDTKDIKRLKEETGAGVMEAKKALEDAQGNYEEAKKELMTKVGAKAAKKADRVTKDGLVASYIHSGGKVGSLVVVACETDFVAKTDDFMNLCREIAMQICAMDYANVEEVLKDEYLKDSSKTIQDIIRM